MVDVNNLLSCATTDCLWIPYLDAFACPFYRYSPIYYAQIASGLDCSHAQSLNGHNSEAYSVKRRDKFYHDSSGGGYGWRRLLPLIHSPA